jgi:Putative beta-barrel porin-2, OmpL-like. bbp2
MRHQPTFGKLLTFQKSKSIDMKKILAVIITIFGFCVNAQIINTGVMDTADFRYQGKVTIEGYIDAYYTYDFNKPASGGRPYFVSMARHNEMTINLAFVDVKYSSTRLRARFVPGFGTYINANYLNEPGALKNIVEANAGIKLFKGRSIWFDFGVFGSPYTNESAISKDHLAYTRSFAPEYVPYYLSGAKVSVPLSKKLNAYFYFINGWQQMQDANSGKSIGTQLEYRPTNNWLLNWNTYIGSETTSVNPEFGTRYFTDFFFIHSKGKWSATGCVYIGLQKRAALENATWWQANLIARYDMTPRLSVTARAEYFDDSNEVLTTPITGVIGLSSYSGSLGLNSKPAENMLFRMEYRTFYSTNKVYERGNSPVKNSDLITTSVAIWF